jgi:hypothetical protein
MCAMRFTGKSTGRELRRVLLSALVLIAAIALAWAAFELYMASLV